MDNIIYTCIRGSHLYGLNTENSDLDTASIYIADSDELYGLQQFYIPYKSDEKQDNTIFEIGRVIELLVNSNPIMLELIFADNEHIAYKHPVIQLLLDNKEKFLSKQVIKSLSGYARSQIYKARGLNKKIVNPVTERKTPIDFCFTFNDQQGTEPITQWLEKNGLKQKYCGLNHLPNMNQMYGVFYDWQQHLKMEYKSDLEFFKKFNIEGKYSLLIKMFPKWNASQDYDTYLYEVWNNAVPKGYHGIQKEEGSSNQIHLDSILKGDKPICYLSYNENGYQTHCRQYKEYKEWEQKRNPIRYESNLNKNYDCYLESETEFLTNHGWKKYDDITKDDLLGCFNDSHVIEYKPWLDRFIDNYSGEIYSYESPYLKYSITPNHKLYVSKVHRNSKNNYNRKHNPALANWCLIPISDLMNKRQSHYHQLQNLQNAQPDNLEYSDDFIKLLGMFISEGCYIKSKVTGKPLGIQISQTNDRCGCSIMDSITSIPLRTYCYKYKSRNKGKEWAYQCVDKNILNKILECGFCGALEKDIPQYVYSFSKRQFDILLDALICGDGYNHKKGHRIYYTSSKKLAKSLQTLLILNGYNAQIYGGKYGSYIKRYTSSFLRKDNKIFPVYQVFISKNTDSYHVMNINKFWNKRIVTNERIVCFETEYHTLITRNGNKMAFHGNSKNMLHCIRLLTMACELAETGKFNVSRVNIDKDFLLEIKNHQYEYDEIMQFAEDLMNRLQKAIPSCTLPENVDVQWANNLLIQIRKNYYGG